MQYLLSTSSLNFRNGPSGLNIAAVSLSDYFPGTTLKSFWVWNPQGSATATVISGASVSRGLTLANASSAYAYLVKNFSSLTNFDLQFHWTAYSGGSGGFAGFAFLNGANALRFFVYGGATYYVQSSIAGTVSNGTLTALSYLRVVLSSGTFTFYNSNDGISWTSLYSGTATALVGATGVGCVQQGGLVAASGGSITIPAFIANSYS